MSDSVQPHRRQPTRLSCPWDSPGKNTGVGCHFPLQCMKVKVKSLSLVQLLATPWTVAHQAPTSMGFFRHECWSGVPLPSPENLLPYLFPKRYPQLKKKKITLLTQLRFMNTNFLPGTYSVSVIAIQCYNLHFS